MENLNVLLIEDSIIIADQLRHALEELDYAVVATLSNGQTIIEDIIKFKPDICILDIYLEPPHDGIEIAKIIKKEFNIPFIFLTASEEKKIFSRAKQTHPYGFLSKPFHAKDLHATLQLAWHRFESQQKIDQLKQYYENIKIKKLQDVYKSLEEKNKENAEFIHESIAQQLTAIKFNLEFLTHGKIDPTDINLLFQNLLTDISTFSHQVYPLQLENLTVDIAIEHLIKDALQPISLDLTVSIDREFDIDQMLKIHVYRIIVEAVKNIKQHSHASVVTIEIQPKETYWIITIQDNGIGFDYHSNDWLILYKDKKGLFEINQRAELLGATLTVDSFYKKGTQIDIKIPKK